MEVSNSNSARDSGFTYLNGTYDQTVWWNDGMDCYQQYYNAGDNAPVKFTCTFPQSETTASGGWSSNPTIHQWNQTLTGTSFSGRSVTEQNPGVGGGSDGCHFPGSFFAPATTLPGGTWPVNSSNQWGPDFVGWSANAVNYYRAQGRAPCSNTVPQEMVIDCPTGPILYATQTIGGAINATTVVSRRGGSTAIRTWP